MNEESKNPSAQPADAPEAENPAVEENAVEENNEEKPEKRTKINSAYSAEFQLELLGLDPKTMMQPVLDVSCGPDPQLVLHLRLEGVQAYGADIMAPDYPFTKKASWTNSDFGQDKWGTIVSNLGVAEILNAAISEKSPALEGLTLAYYNLLGCLKVGGTFVYAPSVPGLEETIPPELFEVKHEEIRPGLNKTIIKKIKNI